VPPRSGLRAAVRQFAAHRDQALTEFASRRSPNDEAHTRAIPAGLRDRVLASVLASASETGRFPAMFDPRGAHHSKGPRSPTLLAGAAQAL
jgi:hypothetical protein